MGYHQFTGKCDGMCDSCDCHLHPREAKAIREAQKPPGQWTVYGPDSQRSGYAVGRTTYGPPPWHAAGTQWLERRDRVWRQWRSAEAAQKVADEMNQGG